MVGELLADQAGVASNASQSATVVRRFAVGLSVNRLV
jgi:hypothetical protein